MIFFTVTNYDVSCQFLTNDYYWEFPFDCQAKHKYSVFVHHWLIFWPMWNFCNSITLLKKVCFFILRPKILIARNLKGPNGFCVIERFPLSEAFVIRRRIGEIEVIKIALIFISLERATYKKRTSWLYFAMLWIRVFRYCSALYKTSTLLIKWRYV